MNPSGVVLCGLEEETEVRAGVFEEMGKEGFLWCSVWIISALRARGVEEISDACCSRASSASESSRTSASMVLSIRPKSAGCVAASADIIRCASSVVTLVALLSM